MQRSVGLALARWLGVVLWWIFVARVCGDVSPTSVCLRWGHQSLIPGGHLADFRCSGWVTSLYLWWSV
jgi:hypothetical protein